MMAHSIRQDGSDRDVLKAFNEHVIWGATCLPVFCNDTYDTSLFFTYCHRVVDDTLRVPMVLKLLIVGDGISRRFSLVLPYSHSECISIRDLMGSVPEFKGTCFAWSEKEGDRAGFTFADRRLAVAFFAYYTSLVTGARIDCIHASPAHSSYYRQRPLLVAERGDKVTAIVCAPVDAYRNKPAELTYTFGLQRANAARQHRKVVIPFSSTLWVDLGELFDVEFEPDVPYMYGVEGPKGKGWLLIETARDFNLHHL